VSATAHILGSIDVLAFEMWLACRARPLVMVVHGPSTRSTAWRALAQRLGLRVQRWIWLLDSPLDDCRVGLDLLASRGVPTASIWSSSGPSDALRLFVELDFTLPDVVVGRPVDVDPVVALSARLRRPAPWVFPRACFDFAPRKGRHDLVQWLQARHGSGARLLALRSVGAAPRLNADPGFLATLDVRLRRLARLGHFTESPPPTHIQRLAWADAVRDGHMLAKLSAWLNDAEGRRRGGLPVDFTLPRLLGLSETAQMRIIP
jgi:hypothetical protein